MAAQDWDGWAASSHQRNFNLGIVRLGEDDRTAELNHDVEGDDVDRHDPRVRRTTQGSEVAEEMSPADIELMQNKLDHQYMSMATSSEIQS